MLKSLIYSLGSNPKLSLKRFFRGVALFVLAVIFIFLGYYSHYSLQIIGVVILVPALFFAAWGYSGIFANRFSQVLKNIEPKNHDPDLWK
ncbi:MULTISPECIES: hypothetical protein [Pseudoalteromonas]|uniref:Uncharacterized protein n=3 Tax=Pseudoalteromonas TaxID=53246 RepID=Q3IJQ4_PSET1|nr:MULTISPECIES: hypothetical protein [Pseudoalteromonas]ALS34389.1 hypothetical protein PTRA_a3412 [Pseudoalteromonas translucida KMM 520]ASM55503.1 hypothetical protein PNIG_a3633 [Pseudoalteromonas nigrifaciens]MBB1407116.1 hypothetical protein [Pseudoalteromonas sp. SG44-5]MBE0420099.1 hypothetical protein [Pseudoalteromonas nigrifaciens]MBH0071964.1 hypothetical protein [Pseudoalteromonas sp. NZS127]|tara:strand:- start:15850 stop:16119 length:270 start_codon:yes stop_codon:yes gene_type:complete